MLLHPSRLRTCIKAINPFISYYPSRTATVLRRVNPPPLLTKGADVSGRITQEDLDKDALPMYFDGPSEEPRHDPWYFRYEVVEEDADAHLPPIKIILMKSMEDFGKRGQVRI